MDYGHGLISVVMSTGSLGDAIEAGVKPTFFTEPKDQTVWGFMTEHFRRYGSCPDPDTLSFNYPSYDIGDYPQPLGFFVDGLAERRRDALAVNAAQEIVGELNVEGPDRGGRAFGVMQNAMLAANFETTPIKHVNFVDKLKRAAPEWRNGNSKPTIEYGVPSLDAVTGGMRPEQFIVLSGLAKSRKTWTMLHIASNVHAQGYPVIFLTFEMSNDELTERLATLWGKLPYQMVRDKQGITDDHLRSLNVQIHVREQLPVFRGVEDTAGHSSVTTIQALVQEVKPAVVFIDGVYLMTDDITGEIAGTDTKPLTNISRGLKRLAKNQKTIVVVSTQQLYGKTYKGRTSLYGIGYTSAFGQDGDLLIGVEATEDQPNIATMRVHGNRSGPPGGEFHITWNLETGLVEEVGAPGTTEDADYDDIDTD